MDGLILRSLERVESALIALTNRVDDLGLRFVPREEIASMQQTGAAERAALAEKLADVAHDLQQVEDRRSANWKFVVTSVLSLAGLGLTALGTATAVLIFVLNHK